MRDGGSGIAIEHRGRTFDRFCRVQAGGHNGGMGLGASISRQIVARHGGRIGAQHPTDGGACFVVGPPASEVASIRDKGGEER